MNLLFSEYLSPTNPSAASIVTILKVFFLLWFVGLVAYGLWLFVKWRQMKKYEDVYPLVNAREKLVSELEESEQKTHAQTTFSKFCEERSLSESMPITKHLKAIFLAGWEESRLEVGELINHTTSHLLKWNTLLRSVLAVFIVIGLLGTLFGLTESLTQLSPALEASSTDETSTESGEKMTRALSVLLGEIKSAFAPSILGIIFTIFGVILYNVYLQLICHPVKSILERLTLTIWIPQLYPTTSQKLIQTLQHSEAQMRRGYEAATKVGELVGTVQSNISDFNENLGRANAITQPLSNSVSQINMAADVFNEVFTEKLRAFLEQFATNVTHLTSFQAEIRNLYQQLTDESETFQRGANEKLDAQTQKLDAQNQDIVRTLNALENYESIYINACQKLDETLQQFLSKVIDANTNIHDFNHGFLAEMNTTNREWIKEIQYQLRENLAVLQPSLEITLKTLTDGLTTNLKEVQETLDRRLERLTDQLNFLEHPLESAARRIEGIVENDVIRIEGVVKNLEKQLQEQNENYKDQLTAVTDLNQDILGLLDKLDKNSENQSNAVNALNSAVSSLPEDIQKLTGAIHTFTSDSGAIRHSIATIEKHTERLGIASQQFVEKVEKADVTPLTDNIGRLNTAVDEISQDSRTLANAVDKLAQRMRVSEAEVPDRTRKKRSFFGKINPFSRKKTVGQTSSESKSQGEGK